MRKEKNRNNKRRERKRRKKIVRKLLLCHQKYDTFLALASRLYDVGMDRRPERERGMKNFNLVT
jgi:hypothetical protein